jgi:hypothetical protein
MRAEGGRRHAQYLVSGIAQMPANALMLRHA